MEPMGSGEGDSCRIACLGMPSWFGRNDMNCNISKHLPSSSSNRTVPLTTCRFSQDPNDQQSREDAPYASHADFFSLFPSPLQLWCPEYTDCASRASPNTTIHFSIHKYRFPHQPLAPC